MAKGLKAFRSIQISNPEGTPGTPEAAIEVIPAVMNAPYHDKTFYYPNDDRNNLALNMGDEFIVQRYVEGTMEGDLNSRIGVWLFSNSIRGNVTATRPNAETQPLAYYWAFEPGLTTANTPDITDGIDTFTLEYGDSNQYYEANFVFTRTLTLSGGPNAPVKYSWEWAGATLSETTKTAGLVIPTSQKFSSNRCSFYIDTSWATRGATVQTCMLTAWEWKLETKFTPLYTADGQLYFTCLKEDKKAPVLTLTYVRDTASELEKDKFEAGTTVFLAIKCLADTEIDAGQANPPYVALEGAYKYKTWGTPGDEDGTTIEQVTAEGTYDTTGAAMMYVAVYTPMNVYP